MLLRRQALDLVLRSEGRFPLALLGNSSDDYPLLKIVDGKLWVKSKRSALNIISGEIETDELGYMNTGDLVESRGDRVLFLGRESGAINVGGNKVIPEEVELVLRQLPFVGACRVFGKKNPMLGMIVAADVRLNEGISNFPNVKKSIIEHCRAKLAAFQNTCNNQIC